MALVLTSSTRTLQQMQQPDCLDLSPRRAFHTLPRGCRQDDEDTHGRRVEKEVTSSGGWKPQPSRRKHSGEHARAPKAPASPSTQIGIAPRNDPIDSSTNIRGCRRRGGRWLENAIPAWCLGRWILFRGQSFVLPIVPFDEVGIDFGPSAPEARELSRCIGGRDGRGGGAVRTSDVALFEKSFEL